MNNHMTNDQGQQRIDALQREASRLADQARDQLADYAKTIDVTKQTKRAKSAAQHSSEQLQQAAGHASDQVAATMATALEDAASQLRTYTGSGPAAKAARTAAGALEQSSEALQPWAVRSMMRRFMRIVRHNPVLAVLATLGVIGVALLSNRAQANHS